MLQEFNNIGHKFDMVVRQLNKIEKQILNFNNSITFVKSFEVDC
jgi:hypothetical protein